MAVRFVGIDPSTEHEGSPTVWVDEDEQELLIQGWNLSPEKAVQLSETEWVPGHVAGIPEGENVVRIPVRMIPDLEEGLR